MKQKFKFIGGILLLVLGLMFFCSPVNAALDLGLGSITDVNGSSIPAGNLRNVSMNLIDAYYSNPNGRNPTDTTGRLRLAPNITTYNTVGETPVLKSDWADPTAKYRAYISAENYFFTRHTDDDSPGATVYVRVWSSSPNTQGGDYSLAQGFGNGTTSTVTETLNAQTSYKADVPYAPNITRFEETATTLADGTKSASLKVYSAQPAPTNGIRELTAYSWEMGTARGALAPVGGATDAVLQLNSTSLTVGTTYYFKATHSNWFGSASSDIKEYTVSGATGGGNVYNLGIRFGAADPNVKLTWQAGGSLSNFDFYCTTADPVTGPWIIMDGGGGRPPKPNVNNAGDADPTTFATDDFSVAGNQVYFRVVPAGADIAASPREVAGKYVYTLRHSTAVRTGINSITLPFSRNWLRGLADPVTNAEQVRNNLLAAFEFLGGWNEVSQSEYGVLAADAPGAGTGTLLEAGKGYQVSIGGSDLSWMVIGVK